MPYISQKHRIKLNPLIDALARGIVSEVKKDENNAAFAGLLNYACTRLAVKIVRLKFGAVRYWLVAILTGVFKNIADEFYRRIGIPYEDKQIAKNGDVDLYKEYSKEINETK